MTREEAKEWLIPPTNCSNGDENDPIQKHWIAYKMAIKALEQEPCKDAISRKAAIDAVKKNTFRLTFAEEQGCEGHVLWSAKAVPSDAIEGALLELPPVTPQPKTGWWKKIEPYPMMEHEYRCSECYHETDNPFENYCSECGAKMEG